MSVIFIISVSSWVLQPQIHFFAEYQDMYNDDGWGQEDEEEFQKQVKRERGKETGMSLPAVTTIIPSLQWLC